MAKPASHSKNQNKKKINLALQGGGSHGAFTWGVLDRLLEEDCFDIDGISATSAGAMNASVMICGFQNGGVPEARRRLEAFWYGIHKAGCWTPLQPTAIDRMTNNWNMDASPVFFAMEVMGQVLSPYQVNPMNINPLRKVLEEHVNINCVHTCMDYQLFVSATNVRTGKIKIFDKTNISIDSILASACLPTVFQAVEIGGQHYWDGGFLGNPALFPLFYNTTARDIVLVQINNLMQSTLPTTGTEIMNRTNEITFNSSLMGEVRAVAFVKKLLAENRLDTSQYKDILLHMITDPDQLAPLGVMSKFLTDWDFLTHLRDAGRQSAEDWLHANYDKVENTSSFDWEETFL